MKSRLLFAGLVVVLVSLFGSTAQAAQDRRGEETTDSYHYHGRMANAPIGPEYHIENEGGSDGAGLCVICSLVIAGAYQGVEDLDQLKQSQLWIIAKSRPGGYYPEKLERLLKEVYPESKWVSWEGDNTELVEYYSRQGYPVCTTTNTGALYKYQAIHHMIVAAHVDPDFACLIDNNDPRRYHWMPRGEFDRRFKDGPTGWGFVWLASPLVADASAIVILTSVFLTASAVLLFISRPFSSEPLS